MCVVRDCLFVIIVWLIRSVVNNVVYSGDVYC